MLFVFHNSKNIIHCEWQTDVFLEPVEDLRWSSFAKIVIGLKPLTIFAKEAPSYMFDWVLYTPLASIGRKS